MERFDKDVAEVVERLIEKGGRGVESELLAVRDKLSQLYEMNLVKINHSVLEVLCAYHLAKRGYEVEVEHKLNDLLVCDIYGLKGNGRIIVEIETGFTPPEHALDPGKYLRARVASKVARYSAFADKFGLATPQHNVLEIPRLFLKPPKHRTMDEISEVKLLCDEYYGDPPISMEEIRNARLHMIYILNVDELTVREIDPQQYHQLVSPLL